MGDFPNTLSVPSRVLATYGSGSAYDTINLGGSLFNAASAWPAVNRAIYTAVYVERTVTAFQMATQVGTQSGNCDVGIYDSALNRLVSMGSTAVGTTGVQVFNIADTVLTPGVYFLAMCVDNTTATFQRTIFAVAGIYGTLGVQQQAVGAVTLPNPAVFAAPAAAYLPVLMASVVATI